MRFFALLRMTKHAYFSITTQSQGAGEELSSFGGVPSYMSPFGGGAGGGLRELRLGIQKQYIFIYTHMKGLNNACKEIFFHF